MTRKRLVTLLSAGLAAAAFAAGAAARLAWTGPEPRRPAEAPQRPSPSAPVEFDHA
ncbi:hypothetical protein [Brevundimonas naejangsanensis]